jgi:hypothetical protein
MLVVMAAVMVRYVVNKLRARDDPEEGLQPWEDPDLWEHNRDNEDPP